MDQARAREHLLASRVAHLATVGPDGRPHAVPICFALERDTVYFAVDQKPKRTSNLRRLRNISANPGVAMVVDHYEDGDWTRLWWVRVEGTARIVESPEESEHAIELLAGRYPQYAASRPQGPVVAI